MQFDGRLQLFGQACWITSQRSVELPDNLPGYLIAYLACRGDWVERETLVALFWPDRMESEALHNLRANLHRARKLLGDWSADQALESQPRRVRIAVPTDIAKFRAAIGRGAWASAALLHPRTLLRPWSFRGFALVEEWAGVERAALDAAWRSAALRAAEQHELAGQPVHAAQLLLRLLESLDAPTEDAVQMLLRVAADAGQRDAALAQHERLRQWLRDDLDVEPTHQTEELARVLRQPDSAAPSVLRNAMAGVPRAVLQPPRLIGRDAERTLLAERSRCVVLVAGEPGVGKSRLLEEALPGACWIACREGLQRVPFAPLIEWIDDQRDALPELGVYRRDLARLVPALLEGEQLPPPDPATAKPRLQQALLHLLETRRVALVFDDVQWVDAATRELIVLLARRATVSLRLAFRSNEIQGELQALLDSLDASGPVDRIDLQALTADDLLQLLTAMSGSPVAAPLFNAWLHRRTGGNPFFVLQTLRALFESGRLDAARGVEGWASALDAITQDYSELQIPSRVTDLIGQRVRAMSADARRVLTVVAVAGDARAVEPIANVAGLSPWATAEAIAELQRNGLLRDHAIAHDLVRQSVYGAVPDSLRSVLHAGVACHFAGRLREEQIAEHWWQAGDTQQALPATVRASASLRHAGLHDEALALTARAMDRVSDSAETARLLVVRARIRLERGELAEAEADAGAALDQAVAPHDRAAAFLVISSLRIHQGRVEDARLAMLEAAGSDADHEGLLIESARVAELQGRASDVVGNLALRLAQLRLRPPGHELVRVLTSLGGAYNDLGEVERGLECLMEAYRLAGHLNARYAQVDVAINLLWGLSALGRNEEAVAIAEEALALGEYDSTPTLRNNLCWSLRELGRVEDAMRLSEVLVAGSDPTLALIALARLTDMRLSTPAPSDEAARLIDAMLARLDSTDIYVAHTSAARTVLRHGSSAQVDRILGYLKPHAIDPWMHRELSAAMVARGIDPLPHIGAEQAS